MDFFGYNFPFYSDTTVLPQQVNERLIKNDILQLLLTSFGERVKRPSFGTPVRRSSFEPLDDITINRLRNGIEEALAIYEPRVIFKDIIINTTPDNYLMSITVLAALKREPNRVLEIVAPLVSRNVSRPQQQRSITANG